MIAERRWDRKVSSSPTLAGLDVSGERTLVLLPCSSPLPFFEYLEKAGIPHLRCCDLLTSCRFSRESSSNQQSCQLHCPLPLSVFQVFGVLTGELASARQSRAVQWVHPKATPQGELDEAVVPQRGDNLLIDGTARRLSSTPSSSSAADLHESDETLELPPGRLFRILVVDDNLLMRKIISSQLGQLGCTNVRLAESGAVALDLCSREEFDLVLVDYQMPFMSGLAVCEKLREQEREGRRRRVVALHSASFIEFNERMGADFFIEKPFSLAKLRAILHKFVQLPQEKCNE
jgi:CheY-like chemotaxis protein